MKLVDLATRLTTVVVQLAGDPVTVADAAAAAPLTDSQKQSLRGQLRAAQAPVESQVRSHGGQVLASYQSSYNGFKVQIAADQAASLASLPGVVAVHPLELVQPSNTNGIPLIGAPQVWDGLNGLHGEGIKIADIDTGIDYTHADFGGSGNPADYQTALASDALPANPLWFGPSAPKVKGGYDFVGDAYNPEAGNDTPVPDPNPLDCNSHGTHTAGTMAGFGVLANGHMYTGPYNATTVSGATWLVGPGVAPKADIYALKIFGCAGGTNEVIDAIEWAVDHNMDVINMSLGSPFGSADSPDAEAAENAAHDGVIVVTSSGNEGNSPYMTGTPGTGNDVISTAANDAVQSTPAVLMGLSSGNQVTAQNSNGYGPLPSSPLNVLVLKTSTGGVSFGCLASDYPAGGVPPNTAVVVLRGGPLVNGTPCARAHKAVLGQQEGAAVVVMLNVVSQTAGPNDYPPYDGPIAQDPNTGQFYVVTIPFLGVKAQDAPLVAAVDGGTTTLAPTSPIPNAGFERLAGFSSQGPRSGDSFLKPNITAPGVTVFSAGMGTGVGPLNDSGTSMAAPHVTGTAALVKQAHPDWRKVKYWDAAIENTADPSGVSNYTTRGAGTGLVQALPAVQTQVVALGDKDMGVLNYGFNELTRDFNDTDVVHLRNFGNSWATFNVADSLDQGSAHSISVYGSTVSVPPRSSRDVVVKLSVPAASAGGASFPGDPSFPFNDVAGVLTFSPVGSSNNGVTLRVPYYMVPQAVSNVDTRVETTRASKKIPTTTTTATSTNYRGAADGSTWWFDWGIKDKRDHGLHSNDIQAVGATVYPGASFGGQDLLYFAISTNHRWSNAAQNVFDVFVDVNGDGHPDFQIQAADDGALQGLDFNGVMDVAVEDLATQDGVIDYTAIAATDSNTIMIPVDSDLLCSDFWGVSGPCYGDSPRFTYTADAASWTDGTVDTTDMTGSFNPTSPAVNNGMFDQIAPNGSVSEALTVNPAEQAIAPSLGWLVISQENKSREESQLVPVSSASHHDH